MDAGGACRSLIRCGRTAVIAIAVIIFAAFIFFFSSPSSAQQPKTAARVPAFRSSARLVLIDVLVADRDGNPVHGLRRDEFTLSDDGHKQTISGFEEHRREVTTEVRPPFAVGPEARTNWVPVPSTGAVNIIVFDFLNSLAGDRAYGRAQLVELLKSLPAGQQVALFTLNTRLRMVQDFTTKTDLLIRAAEKMNTGSGPLSAIDIAEILNVPAGSSDSRSGISAGPSSGGQGSMATSQPPSGQSAEKEAAKKEKEAAKEVKAAEELYTAMLDTRVAYTLDAFRDLAKATASLPGRKNVIWLTPGFPIKIDGTMLIGGRTSEVLRDRDYTENVRSAAAALASAQIAIYPIDMTGIAQPVKLVVTEKGADWVERKPLERFDERATLQTVAEETGGRAYYDRNDLDGGIREVLVKGSDYYTLAYSPRTIKWDGSYHRVGIRLARTGLTMTFRRGYHAVGDTPLTTEQASTALGEALRLDLIDSRMILLAAQVVQPEAPGQPIKVKCSIAPDTLVLDTAADLSKNALLGIGATAWDGEKHKAGEVAKRVEVVLKPDQLATAKNSGIPWTLEMPLNPGAYTLKVGVVDLSSGKTGSITVQVNVEIKPRVTATEVARIAPAGLPATAAPAQSTAVTSNALEEGIPVPPFDPNATAISDYCRSLAQGNARPDALRSICEFSLSVRQRMPNYICDEKLKRWASGSIPGSGSIPETVEAELAFVDGQQSFSKIRINGKPSDTMSSDRFPDFLSTGEFGSQLLNLFAPENQARFRFEKEVTLSSKPALLFSFDIKEGENRTFKVWNIDGTSTRPGYKGSMWVDKNTRHLLRLEMTSKQLRFQRSVFRDMKFETNYTEVRLADGSTFLLPSRASVSACTPAQCLRNDLEFSNCHRFKATGKMVLVP